MRRFNIIVAGLHPQTGDLRKETWSARFDNVGFATQFEQDLQSRGFTTTYIDQRKGQGKPQRNDMEIAANFSELKFPYMLHSLGTKAGHREGDHVAGAEDLKTAIDYATDKLEGWCKSHRGIVIYRASKIVRHTAPPRRSDRPMIWLESILATFAAGLVAFAAVASVLLVCLILSMLSSREWFRFLLGILVVYGVGALIVETFDLWAT